MATKANNTAPKANNKKQALAPVVSAPVASAPTANTVPLFTCSAATWPARSQGGNTMRAYAFKVAVQLTKAHPKGFTLVQYKAALVSAKVGNNKTITGFATPSSGWQGHNMPTWASNPKQAWLVPA